MLLAALNDYARRRGLLDEVLWATRPVYFLLRITHEGRFVALVPTAKHGAGMPMRIPRPPQRASNVAAGFLVDNPKYVLGLAEGSESQEKKAGARVSAFHSLAAMATEATRSPVARAVAAFTADASARAQALAARPSGTWTGTELLAFVVEGSDVPAHEEPALREWWENRGEADAAEGDAGQCLVSGDVTVLARLHERIRGVPGTLAMGGRLVSTNNDAFESHGLEQGANAPVGKQAALGYVLALNHLLEPTPKRNYRHGIRLAEDTVLVLWTDGPAEEAEQLLTLMDPTSPELKRMPTDGVQAPEVRRGARLFAVTLSGNMGRVAIRDMLEVSLTTAVSNVRRFLDDLRIHSAPARPMPVWRLLNALEDRAEVGVPPDLATRMVRAILTGSAFPQALLVAALKVMTVERRGDDADGLHVTTRAQLIHACLLRSGGTAAAALCVPPTKDGPVALVLGRLLAVLEQLDGGEGFRERHFARFSHSPANAFPTLLRRAIMQERRHPRLARLMGELVAALPGSGFPKALGTEDRGLVAVGYARQRCAL
ncbi:type I-C CRISPR-associated protein Cas8c/Csd1 [Myxococcus sp. MxC21-1]|uniref:type I-C CRISPR-associated protein Cas8c/Csd1 n=1 Tax=Myxococcus sp. MxC21-1 TaxID=3041439 RepID=UPI0029316418|nr:type I-C CRISPR-associated protein Cas8c/Csd1 [Myxococcus sp. MxC21-1]WNZ59873.1 type I-C CRISPR-associated protein Cas8c/Csd1 [Myxococcus sp. MxC21-1]